MHIMEIVELISEERLATFEKITASRKHSIALHNQTLQLASSLMSTIAIFELALRNATNIRLVSVFGDFDWLLEGRRSVPLHRSDWAKVSSAQTNARKAAYAKLNGPQKRELDRLAFPDGVPDEISRKEKVNKRRATIIVSHGQVLAQTTFYFWKRLYSSEYEDTLWKPALKQVFPNKKLKRGEIADALEHVYRTRNRVAHHEPVYGDRLENAMRSLEFLRNTFDSKEIGANSEFRRFSNVQYLRLQMDYEAFKNTWETLT